MKNQQPRATYALKRHFGDISSLAHLVYAQRLMGDAGPSPLKTVLESGLKTFCLSL